MIRYATLFTFDIVHDYFLNRGAVVHEALSAEVRDSINEQYSVDTFADITPTRRTLAQLAGHKMIFKATRTGFLVAVKTDTSVSDSRPALPPGADFRLDFRISIRDPRFFNYSELPASNSALYRFCNSSDNLAESQLFLTAPVQSYDTMRAYEAGAIYAANAVGVNNLFRAVRDTGPAGAPIAEDWQRIPVDTWNPATSYAGGTIVLFANRIYRALVDTPGTDLNDTSDWEELMRLANQYASSADKLSLRPAVFNMDLGGGALTQATLRVYRLNEIDALVDRTYTAPSGTLGVVSVDLRDLAPGAYRLEVLDSALVPVANLGFKFYLDTDAVRDAWFGVIEIGMGSGEFALMDGSGALRSPRYLVRFLNRSTRWRYIFPKAQALGAGADVAVEGSDSRVLVTGSLHPLTYFGSAIRLQSDKAGTPTVNEEVLLPLPEPHRIRRANQQWYSDIHLSNLRL